MIKPFAFWLKVVIHFSIKARKREEKKVKLMNNKKGQIEALVPLVISLVVIGILIVVAFLIFAQVAANTTVQADTNATAAIVAVQEATDDIPGWLPIIVVVVIGALLIGLVSFLRGRAR